MKYDLANYISHWSFWAVGPVDKAISLAQPYRCKIGVQDISAAHMANSIRSLHYMDLTDWAHLKTKSTVMIKRIPLGKKNIKKRGQMRVTHAIDRLNPFVDGSRVSHTVCEITLN